MSKPFFWAQGLAHSTLSTSDSRAVWASRSSSGTRVLPEHTRHLVLCCGSHSPPNGTNLGQLEPHGCGSHSPPNGTNLGQLEPHGCGSHFPAWWDQPRAAGGPWEVHRGLEVQQEVEKPFLERERAMRGMAGRRPASSLYRVPLLYPPRSRFVGRIYPPNIQAFTSEVIWVAFFFHN